MFNFHAFNAGAKAFENQERANNPHNPGTVEFTSWNEGYFNARYETKHDELQSVVMDE